MAPGSQQHFTLLGFEFRPTETSASEPKAGPRQIEREPAGFKPTWGAIDLLGLDGDSYALAVGCRVPPQHHISCTAMGTSSANPEPVISAAAKSREDSKCEV